MTQQVNGSAPISCAEFQEHLPELFTNSDGTPTDPTLQAHLNTCDNCSALVRDLQYIADQARMLLEPAEEEPSDAVWTKIHDKLQSDAGEAELRRNSCCLTQLIVKLEPNRLYKFLASFRLPRYSYSRMKQHLQTAYYFSYWFTPAAGGSVLL